MNEHGAALTTSFLKAPSSRSACISRVLKAARDSQASSAIRGSCNDTIPRSIAEKSGARDSLAVLYDGNRDSS